MIPKKIHYCWFGNTELPDKDKKCIESWKKYCPDYEIIRWDESNFDITKCKYMRQAYGQKKWGFVPDFARLDIIYNEGGIYLDTDVELIKGVEDLLDNSAFMGFEDRYSVNLGSGFGAEKHNKIIGFLRDMYYNISFIDKDGNLNLTASPMYTTKGLQNLGLILNNQTQMIYNIKIYPSEWFSPIDFSSGIVKKTVNTHSIHHYNMSWKDEEEKGLILKKQKNIQKFGLHIGNFINRINILFFFIKRYGFKVVIKKLYKRILNS